MFHDSGDKTIRWEERNLLVCVSIAKVRNVCHVSARQVIAIIKWGFGENLVIETRHSWTGGQHVASSHLHPHNLRGGAEIKTKHLKTRSPDAERMQLRPAGGILALLTVTLTGHGLHTLYHLILHFLHYRTVQRVEGIEISTGVTNMELIKWKAPGCIGAI